MPPSELKTCPLCEDYHADSVESVEAHITSKSDDVHGGVVGREFRDQLIEDQEPSTSKSEDQEDQDESSAGDGQKSDSEPPETHENWTKIDPDDDLEVQEESTSKSVDQDDSIDSSHPNFTEIDPDELGGIQEISKEEPDDEDGGGSAIVKIAATGLVGGLLYSWLSEKNDGAVTVGKDNPFEDNSGFL